jgi:2-keto-3-deoxy-6-phosphogluconate aldolase
MATYKKDRKQVDAALRKSGIVVVMNRDHVKTPEHMVITMTEVWKAGFVAECTMRIDEGILLEGMKELVKVREKSPADNPFVLGVGSILNPKELESAIAMGFDMIVAPANVMGGYGEGVEFIKRAHEENIFAAPAIMTPTEFNYLVERPDGMEPDGIKIFPAGVLGPKGFSDLLAPFVRERHANRIIMPTGAVNFETGPEYQKAIKSRGFFPVLGMSAPLEIVTTRKKPGDVDTIKESLAAFRAKFQPYKG